MTTGERIKNLRVCLGMSQSELGARIGVKTPAVYKYENGLVVNLKRSTIEKLATALETTPSYLMGFEDEKEPTPVSEDGPLSPDDARLMDMIRQLTPENKKKFAEKLEVLIEFQSPHPEVQE